MTQDFTIPAQNLSQLLAEIAKLAKRATRLGVTVPVVTVGDQQVKVIPGFQGAPEKVEVTHVVTLTSEVVKLAGWSFLGTLDHAEGGVIVRAVPGVALPVSYRTAAADCQHCNAARKRNSTFVLLHDDGTYKQVGRQCLADFLGVDPTKAAQSAEYLAIFGELLGSGEDEGFGGGGHSRFQSLQDFLGWVALSIRLDGWVSRSKAAERGGSSTTDNVAARIYERSTKGKGDKPSVEDFAAATSAIEWAQSLRDSGEELSDYLHNVAVIAASPAVHDRSLGIAASIIPAYDRAQGKLFEKKQTAVSVHFGTPKKREEFTLTVTGTHSFDGYAYGTTRWLVRLKDEAGNVATWWTGDEGLHQFNTGIELKEGVSRDIIGQTFEVKATVKAHEDYKGTKQTVLTRVTVIENVTEATERSLTSNLL